MAFVVSKIQSHVPRGSGGLLLPGALTRKNRKTLDIWNKEDSFGVASPLSDGPLWELRGCDFTRFCRENGRRYGASVSDAISGGQEAQDFGCVTDAWV